MAQIEYLGLLSDRCGRQQHVTLPETITDVASLREWLNSSMQGAPLAPSTIRAIVNGKVVADAHPISDTDTIAFFPPVGGG